MVDDPAWLPLHTELDRWQRAGRVADLWLRDDDAVAPTAALDRLLDLTAHHAIPAVLAVIPARTGEPLAARLASEPRVAVAVHGWAHENHAPGGEKKQELGRHRRADIVLGELSRATAVIDRLFADKAAPVLVPPWNRIDGALLPSLPKIGFAALSIFGTAKAAAIPVVNTHVDIIDWHGSRGGKDHGGLVLEIAAQLGWRRETGSREAVGVLTHHLVHDEIAWRFLENLLGATVENPACRWASIRDLV